MGTTITIITAVVLAIAIILAIIKITMNISIRRSQATFTESAEADVSVVPESVNPEVTVLASEEKETI